MKKDIRVIVHPPKADADREALEMLVAQAHAHAVLTYLRKLNCPAEQKRQLLEAVIQNAKDGKGS